MRRFITLVADTGELFISLVEGEKIIGSISAPYDANGGRDAFFTAARNATDALITRHGFTEEDITSIFASANLSRADHIYEVACLDLPLTLREMREDAYENKYKEPRRAFSRISCPTTPKRAR